MWPFQRIMVKLGRNFLKCPENSSGCESAKNLSVKVFVMEKPENNQKCSSIWDWFSQLSVSILFKGFPGGSAGRESARNAGDLGWEDPLEKGTATHSNILAGDFHGLCSPWNSPGHNTGVGKLSFLQGIFPTQVSCIAGGFSTSWATRGAQECWISLSLLQWIFPTQELNRGLLHCRRILYQLSCQGSPDMQIMSKWYI